MIGRELAVTVVGVDRGCLDRGAAGEDPVDARPVRDERAEAVERPVRRGGPRAREPRVGQPGGEDGVDRRTGTSLKSPVSTTGSVCAARRSRTNSALHTREFADSWSKCVLTTTNCLPVRRSANRTHVTMRITLLPHDLEPTTSGVSDSQRWSNSSGRNLSASKKIAMNSS